MPLRKLPRITWDAFPSLMMPVVLLGGIYSGVMTPTEAAAVAAAYALLISAGLYRSVSWRGFYNSLAISARTSVSIGMLIAGSLVFNYVVTVENIPESVKKHLKIIPVAHVDEVIAQALARKPEAIEWEEPAEAVVPPAAQPVASLPH